MDTQLYFTIKPEQCPIIYSAGYNVRFCGLERCHPFDARKWGNIIKYLKSAGLITDSTIIVPKEATREDLLVVHTKKYLRSLKCSMKVACISEIFLLSFVPNYFVDIGYLKPMRLQVGGSILAGKVALERGYAINIGGGLHHCSSDSGGGFCAYADITLLIHFVFNFYAQTIQNVMIVDLDAHQGNGHERDFKDNPNVYIMDVYNRHIYPFDHTAKKYITRKIELDFYVKDTEYLKIIQNNLSLALEEFRPQLIVYNAGTDILEGDPLGGLSISEQGIILRDEIVFRAARSNNIPIVMLTSGGYLKKSAKIIATSIMNLYDSKLIDKPIVKH